jgi:hypothetical protein
LPSTFVPVLNKKIPSQKKCNMGIKNAEFDADFESVVKDEKTHAKKSLIFSL